MPDQRDKILQFIQRRGPVIPIDISKYISSDTLIASAYLSQLVSENKVKVSFLKFGGSPLYYLKGQEPKLLDYVGRLKAPEQRAVELLKEKKVLNDHELEMINRVALRNARDFAIPFKITVGEESEIFWKFYLITDEEAKEIIKKSLDPDAKEEEKPTEKPIEEKSKAETKVAEPQKIEPLVVKEEKPNIQASEEKTVQVEIKPVESKPKKKAAEKKTEQKQTVPKEDDKKSTEPVKEEVTKPSGPSLEVKPQDNEDPFLQKIKAHFEKEGIIIKESKLIRKGSDYELIIQVPSPIGKMELYCKAKDKKKINDGDLSSAFVQGQMKKLPVLFLTTGELSKKAKEMMGQEFSNMKVNVI